MKKSILSICFALASVVLIAQETTCGHTLDTTATEFRENEKALTQAINNPMKSNAVINVPVVFHVLHKGEAYGVASHITEEQVISALVDLNEHFSNDYGANVGIEFCMAQVDPEGNPTNGIDYIDGCQFPDYCTEGIGYSFSGPGANEFDVKSATGWPNQQYYNIWLVWSIGNNFGFGGVQGYAWFPTTSVVDGIVQLSNATGTVGTLKSYTNLNKTLVHEMGHAFSLFHTFGSGTGSCSPETNCLFQGDRVCDTPPQTQATFCTTGSCGFVSENHLDYLKQECRNLFTEGQKTRMRASATVSRANLIASNKCESPLLETDLTMVWIKRFCINSNFMQVGWRTSLELNVDYFVLQNSLDGVTWNSLDTVQAVGNSTMINNYLLDVSFTSLPPHWRLQWVDLNGDETNLVGTRKCEPSGVIAPGLNTVVGIYNVYGTPLDRIPSREIYIIAYSDGTYQKHISE